MTAHTHAPGDAHSHAHSHAPPAHAPPAPRAAPAGSLLRMSVAARLAIALGLVALIWLCVFWALQ